MNSKRQKPASKKPHETRLSRGRNRPDAIFPVAPTAATLPESYAATLQEIKAHLRSARVRAVLAANPIVIEGVLADRKDHPRTPARGWLGSQNH